MAERHKLLLESPSLIEQVLPRRSSRSSTSSFASAPHSNGSSAGYILHVTPYTTPSKAFYAASSSNPYNVIDLFDRKTLVGVQTLSGHEGGVTGLKNIKNFSASGGMEALLSSGKDGTVKVWDERTKTHAIKMNNAGKNQALLCFDVSPDGKTVAAGTDLQGEEASILYWDPRNPTNPLRVHSSTHSDDITTLSYAPFPLSSISSSTPSGEPDPYEGISNILLSGSTDGLLCTSNADQDDEDEAVLQIGNWGCSISQAGWIYPQEQKQNKKQGEKKRKGGDEAKIWAASDMETFSTWKEDLDQLLSLDIRSPVLHKRRTWVTDYLITVHSSPTASPNPTIFTGSNEGDLVLLSNMNISVPDAPWCLHKIWSHGHTGIVRSLFWDESNDTLITGGEDGKINLWNIKPVVESQGSYSDEDDDEVMDSATAKSDTNSNSSLNSESEDDEDVMQVDSSPKVRKRGREDDERRGKKARR